MGSNSGSEVAVPVAAVSAFVVISTVIAAVFLCRVARHRRQQQQAAADDYDNFVDAPAARGGGRSGGTVGTMDLMAVDQEHEQYDVLQQPPKSPTKSAKKRRAASPRHAGQPAAGADEPTYDQPPAKLGAAAAAAAGPAISPDEVERGALLGTGSFGAVYAGRWRGLDVAIKEVKSAVGRAQRQALLNEAEGMKRLRPHKNIVTFYGVCQEPALAILVELCSGGSLDDALYGEEAARRRAFTAQQKRQLVLDVCRGVYHLHQEQLVHRDLAARNVLLDAHGTGKVGDFGMARALGDSEGGGSHNYTATTIGPIKWMAPEQMNRQRYSFASDMWALAVVLVELYSERPPWPDTSNMEVARAVVDGGHLRVPPQTPAAVGRLMLRCWAFEPADRPTASQVLAALDQDASDDDWTTAYADGADGCEVAVDWAACLAAVDSSGLVRAVQWAVPSGGGGGGGGDRAARIVPALRDHDGVELAEDLIGLSAARLQQPPYALNARDANALARVSEHLAQTQREQRLAARKKKRDPQQEQKKQKRSPRRRSRPTSPRSASRQPAAATYGELELKPASGEYDKLQ